MTMNISQNSRLVRFEILVEKRSRKVKANYHKLLKFNFATTDRNANIPVELEVVSHSTEGEAPRKPPPMFVLTGQRFQLREDGPTGHASHSPHAEWRTCFRLYFSGILA
jgi:hypothetical protein